MNRKDKEREIQKMWLKHPPTQPGSKFYQQDRADFIRYIASVSDEKLDSIYNNWVVMESYQFEKDCEKEISRLDKAGMFNVGNMSPEHQLD